MKMKFPEYLFFGVCFTILMATPAYAYIDPSVATAALGVITGVIVAVGAVVGVVWRRLHKKVQDKLGIDENAGKEKEQAVEWEDDED